MKKQKVYVVEIYKFPTEITINAYSKEEAKRKAKAQVDFSVWESKVRRID
jgi:hypothetical protein